MATVAVNMDGKPSATLTVDRRHILTLSGVSLTALAGCTSDDDDDPPADENDDDPEPDEPNGDEEDQETVDESDEEDEDGEEEDLGSPSFETSVEHPDEVEVNKVHDMTITVENTGDAAGEFEEILEVSDDTTDDFDNVETITLEIEAGESEDIVYTDLEFSNAGTIQFQLGDQDWEYDVTITEPDIQSFSGTGQSVEQGITIDGGLVVVDATHDGESNFQVSLEDDSEFGDSFINVIGEFDGAQADLIDEGEYLLDINADGSWEIDIRQPRSGDGDELAVSLSGTGPDVAGPVLFEGTGVATGEHDGESNFQVRIFPMTGSFGESLFNEIGEFEGETTYSFDGIGWVDVNADGSWEIELE